MKKVIILFLILIINMGYTTLPANANSHDCKTLNKTKIIKNKTYVCKKKNKKLVWVKLKTPVSVKVDPCACPLCCPVVSTTPTPKPQITIPNRPNTVEITPTPLQTESYKEKHIDKINKDIIKYYNNNQNYKIYNIKSPSVSSDRAKEIVSNYEKYLNFYSFDTRKKMTFVIMNENDRAWWLSKSKEIDGQDNSSWWDSGRCKISSKALCVYGNSDVNNPIYYMLVGSQTVWSLSDDWLAEHEVFHMYQTLSWNHGFPSCWVVEGSANAIGYAMASKNQDTNVLRRGQIRMLNRIDSNYLKLSQLEWYETFKKVDSSRDFCFSTNAGYSIGMLAVESVILEYGIQKTDQFMKDYSKTMNLDQSLINVFKINTNQFYNIVSKYIHDTVGEL